MIDANADFYIDIREWRVYSDLDAAKDRGCIESELIPAYRAAPEAAQMTRERAEKIIKDGGQGWLQWEPGDDTACLDGHYTPEELEAVAFLIRADQSAPQGREE